MASRAPEWRASVKRGAVRSGSIMGALLVLVAAAWLCAADGKL